MDKKTLKKLLDNCTEAHDSVMCVHGSHDDEIDALLAQERHRQAKEEFNHALAEYVRQEKAHV